MNLVHPLSWPLQTKRTEPDNRQAARFSSSKESLKIDEAIARLEWELYRLGAKDAILTSDMALLVNGAPRKSVKMPTDPGVCLYFDLDLKPYTMACDHWFRLEDNVASIAAHIACLRGIDRYWVGEPNQAFAGYAALVQRNYPQPEAYSKEGWRKLLAEHHPDSGGDPEVFKAISEGYSEWQKGGVK